MVSPTVCDRKHPLDGHLTLATSNSESSTRRKDNIAAPSPRFQSIPSDSSSIVSDGAGPEPRHLARTHRTLTIPQVPLARNVIFIGETGSGKSSVINLIIGRDHAAVSPDATPCTRAFTPYEVSFGGRTYRLWDTPGLNEPSGLSRFLRRGTSTVDSLKRFLQERHRRGEVDLLVLCVRGSRATSAMSKAYKAFCRATRQIAPVVIAVTYLERAQPTMDAWWQENERRFGNQGLVFEGHACLTCLSPHHRRRASQEEIRVLISAEYRPRAAWSMVSERDYLNDLHSGCVVC